ncbi:MAG TPA: potassium:proton antiporter [Moorella mulderi]|nr:potassium:proton antiporter [Moorella mulderi]
MPVRETELPGIGKKFEIDTRNGEKLVIIVHDDGRREIYFFANPQDEDSIASVILDDLEARCVAGILGGMVYVPKTLEPVEVALEDMVFEWFKVERRAFAIGKSVGELDVRTKTGAIIIAMLKKDKRILNPGPQEVIEEGMTLVVLGDRKQIRSFKELVLKGSSGDPCPPSFQSWV